MQGILIQLKAEDEMMQLEGLNDLNNFLSVSMEDALSACPVEQLVPTLVIFLPSWSRESQGMHGTLEKGSMCMGPTL